VSEYLSAGDLAVLHTDNKIVEYSVGGGPCGPPQPQDPDLQNWHELRCGFAAELSGRLRWLDRRGGDDIMLWTIFLILLILWLLGLISGYTLGGFVHILLVIAVVVLIIRLIQGRPVA
jgi:hypothetical protein